MRIHDNCADGTFGGNFFAGQRAGSFSLQKSGADFDSGSRNIGVGVYALAGLTIGFQNIAIGSDAMSSATTAFNNVAIGAAAGAQLTTGANNVFAGVAAGYRTSTGIHNVAIGLQALYRNTAGSNNTALGRDAQFSNTTGNWNTSVGVDANPGNETGNGNTAIGGESGYTDNLANQNVTGSYNTWIGYQTGSTTPEQHSNSIAIGYRARINASNQAVIGNAELVETRLFGDVSGTGSLIADRTGTVTSGGDEDAFLALTPGGTRIYEGIGAPTLEAPQGSLYLRTDGVDGAAVYVNANGGTAWAGLLAAARAKAQADAAATNILDLVTDFNALLAKLRSAGLLAT